MAQIGVSLSAVSAAGPGTAINVSLLGSATLFGFANASMVLYGAVANPTGGVAAVPVALEVSSDDSNWAQAGQCFFGSAVRWSGAWQPCSPVPGCVPMS